MIKSIKALFILSIALMTISCGDDCTTCTMETFSFEICEGEGLEYTDIDGNILTAAEAIEDHRSRGFTCE